MTSRTSKTNNCNRPLSGDVSGNTFTGAWESSAGCLVLGVFIASPTLGLLTIQQSNNRGANIQLSDTFNLDSLKLDAMQVFRVPSGFAFFRVIFTNYEGNQTYLSLNTYLESSYTSPTTVSGTVTVAGTVAVSSIISELPAGANTIGVVGIDATNNLVGIDGANNIVNVAGLMFIDNNLNVDVNAPLPAGSNGIGLVGLDPFYPNVVTINDNQLPLGVTFTDVSTVTVTSISNALPTGGNVIGMVGLDPLSANPVTLVGTSNTVQIISGNIVVDSITSSLPTGSNVIGTVGIDGALNVVQIDQTTVGANGVKVNPTALPPVRVVALGNTALSVGGPGLLYGASYQNKSATVNCWVKLYDLPTAPTGADTPFHIQYLEAVQLYTLSHSNDSFFNCPVVNTLWVRATLTADDSDTTDTGVDAEVTFFVGA